MELWKRCSTLTCVVLAIGCTSAAPSAAQDTRVRVRVRVALADSTLAVKPVPFFAVRFVSRASGEAREVITDERGEATDSLRPGEYEVSSRRPVQFGNRSFHWVLTMRVGSETASIQLNNANASVIEPSPGTSPRGAVAGRGGGDDTLLVDAFSPREKVEPDWQFVHVAAGRTYFIDVANIVRESSGVFRTFMKADYKNARRCGIRLGSCRTWIMESLVDCRRGLMKPLKELVYRTDGQLHSTEPSRHTDFITPLTGSVGALLVSQVCAQVGDAR